jgi:hypothetical protein
VGCHQVNKPVWEERGERGNILALSTFNLSINLVLTGGMTLSFCLLKYYFIVI